MPGGAATKQTQIYYFRVRGTRPEYMSDRDGDAVNDGRRPFFANISRGEGRGEPIGESHTIYPSHRRAARPDFVTSPDRFYPIGLSVGAVATADRR